MCNAETIDPVLEKIMLFRGASKKKIYDSELFITKKWKIDQLTPKAQRKFVFSYIFPILI